ncbi:MAG: 50S ribosomal protein L9 [Verrucomicrobiales bacterium]
MPTVEVILKEPIKDLGAEADIVKVKAGYARNFLVPKGKALEATKGNLRHVKALQNRRAEREGKELAEAETLAGKLKKLNLKLTLKTGSDGKAFGSITTMDIAHAVEAQGPKGITIDRHSIQLDKPIKQTGKFEVPVKIHPQVTTTIRVNVTADTEEKPNAETEKAE